MDIFLNKYKELCLELFKDVGFKYTGKRCYRLVNDVFQIFNLHRSVYGTACTIEFGVIPLCYGIEMKCKDIDGAYNIGMFEGKMEWIEYDKHNENSIDECIRKLKYYMEKYLLPFFLKSSDCLGAYCEIEKNYILYEKNFQNAGYKWIDCFMGYMAIKNKDFEKAKKHLIALKNQNINAYKINRQHNIQYSKESLKEYHSIIHFYNELIDRVEAKDLDFIDDLIKRNEEKSMINLKISKIKR